MFIIKHTKKRNKSGHIFFWFKFFFASLSLSSTNFDVWAAAKKTFSRRTLFGVCVFVCARTAEYTTHLT